ncbi:uncharacterized protein LOC100880427 [Megachile rotundata]|uniref:uncharacterized protein LOC100880427 n=1 Tax=Megachile rotundata TaxID=143995 RepID=UPI000258EE00|nr:PREDICTED: four-domain proteases inhibitor-like [Megachile rotundata]
MWLFYVILVAASSGSLVVFAQDDQLPSARPMDNAFVVDGFVFDGPASRPTNTPSAPTGGTTGRSTSTTTSTTASPVSDAEFDACVAACPATPEYNPVCGSDNGDYDNPGRLSCAAACGQRDITVKYYGRCMTDKIRG